MNELTDVFISCNFSFKDTTKKLADELKNLSLKVELDEKDLESNNKPLTRQLTNAIENSKLFVCCLTKSYCESYNNNMELYWAYSLAKPLVVLVAESLDLSQDVQINGKKQTSRVPYIINLQTQINCFESESSTVAEWPLAEIKQAIDIILKDLEEKSALDEQPIRNRYKQLQILGQGVQSIVYKVEDQYDNNKIKAMKRFKKIIGDIKLVEEEIQILKTLDNQYLIKYLDSFLLTAMDIDVYYIVTDLHEKGTLNYKINEKRVTDEQFKFAEIMSWSVQLLEGLNYLHESKIIHRDIKPSNIFLNERGNLVLGYLDHFKYLEKVSDTSNHDGYSAPEVIEKNLVSQMSDIWSFGCVLYEMIKLERLFNKNSLSETITYVMNFNIYSLSLDKLQPVFVNAIMKSLLKDPNNRMNAKNLIQLISGKPPTSVMASAQTYLSSNLLNRQKVQPNKIQKYTLSEIKESINKSESEVHFSEGVSQYNLGNYNSALQSYNRAIELNPAVPSFYLNKGVCLKNLERLDEAIVCYDKVIEINALDSNAMNAFKNKGNCLSSLGKYEESIQCYDKAIQLNPKDIKSLKYKGNCLDNLKRYNEAIVCYDKLIQFDANDVAVMINKGVCLRNLGRYQEAIELFNKAIETNPNDADGFYNKANCLNFMGNYSLAIEMFDKAIEIDSSDSDSFHNKGLSLKSLGNYKEAIECFDKAIQLKPDNPNAVNNRKDTEILLNKKNQKV